MIAQPTTLFIDTENQRRHNETERLKRTTTTEDEVTRDESRSLMDQLVKRMLTVSSRLTPINRAGIAGDFRSIKGDMLAIALHC